MAQVMSSPSRTGLRTEILQSFDQSPPLEEAWNELWTRANGLYHEGYTLCRHSWEDVTKPQGCSLLCILVWDDTRLVLAWPLVRYKKRGVKMMRPLTPAGGEATSILVDPSADVAGATAAAWNAATSSSGSDVFYIPLLRAGSALDVCVPQRWSREADRDVAPCAQLTLEHEWEAYARAIGAGSWQQTTRKRKRIMQLEGSKFACIDPVQEPQLAADLIQWMLVEKQQWARRMHKPDTWVSSPLFREFLNRSITDPRDTSRYRLYALYANNQPIAVKLVAVCPRHLEYVIGAYSSSADMAKLSPGLVLDEFWMRDVFDLHLDVDFGTGGEPYKLFWSKGNVTQLRTYRIPLSLKGKIVLALMDKIREFRSRKNQNT